MSSGARFPRDLVRAQQRVWACEAATRAFVLDGPSSPVTAWPLPRQGEFLRLRADQEAAQRAVREHPLMAAAIADRHWTATVRALCEAAREPLPAEPGAASTPGHVPAPGHGPGLVRSAGVAA